MKKFMVLAAGLCVALTFSSCGSSESAYKKAYEKAKAQEAVQEAEAEEPIATEAPVVTPLETKPVTQTKVVDNVDNATVRQESFTVVSGAAVKAFSVVVGSFSLKANAVGLQNTLKAAGYQSSVVYNSDRNMYRVVASSYSDKAAAVQSRNELRAGKYPDAWLLFKK